MALPLLWAWYRLSSINADEPVSLAGPGFFTGRAGAPSPSPRSAGSFVFAAWYSSLVVLVRLRRHSTRSEPRAAGRHGIVRGCEYPDAQADRPGRSPGGARSHWQRAGDRHLLALCIAPAWQTP